MEDQCVITRQVTVAGGVFAPGHLGELTQIVPFEMVDQALAATGTTQARIRVLPSRVVVYLLLAGGLFAGLGYRQVWHKLTAALGALPVASPGDNALWQARARLGAAPLRWLFDLLRGPATAITAGSVRWGGLLVCAIDGTTMTIPDSPRNLAAYRKQAGNHGGSGYPLLRLVALVACGTRTLIERGLRPGQLRRAGLHPPAAPQPAPRHDRAAGPQLRCRRAARPARRHEGGPAGPRQGQPQAPGAAPLCRRVLPVADRCRPGAGNRMPDHHRHQRRAPYRRLPAGHYLARSLPLPAAA